MLDELRDRITEFISQHRISVISTRGSSGEWAIPTWHHPLGLEMVCLLPRWSDVLYHLEQDPRVMLIILDTQCEALCWLQYRGTARIVDAPDWERILPEEESNKQPDDRYVAIRITPERIDIIDESRGWGARETLDV